MNDKTEALIRELAEKLGTTVEHLWGILVHQAPISGTIDLLVMVAWMIAVIWTYRIVKEKTAIPKPTEDNRFTRAEWVNEGAWTAWLVWGMVSCASIIIIGCFLSDVISAILNPEYWAIKQVIMYSRNV